jgi:hypothetical protein
MSEMGQSRRFRPDPDRSALPSIATDTRTFWMVGFVRGTDIVAVPLMHQLKARLKHKLALGLRFGLVMGRYSSTSSLLRRG